MFKYTKELRAIANAAEEGHEKPWEILEMKTLGGIWETCKVIPSFLSDNIEYRIKPKQKKKLWLYACADISNNINLLRTPLVCGFHENDEKASEYCNYIYIWKVAIYKTNTFIEVEE